MSALDEYNARRRLESGRDKRRKKRMNDAARRAKDKIKREGRCRNPECGSGLPPEWHHAVPRSRFGKWDIAKHDIDNALPVCHSCHMRWHNNEAVLFRSALLPSEVSFILNHAGQAWLDKHYPMEDRSAGIRIRRSGSSASNPGGRAQEARREEVPAGGSGEAEASQVWQGGSEGWPEEAESSTDEDDCQ